ncbi:MAG: enoyl-CoA hydratase family protein [Acidimicrobiales bacterium]
MNSNATRVHLEVSEGIATVTLDSPQNRNALSRQLVGELAGYLESARDDHRVRAITLTATGTVFCSGADLTEAADGGGAGGPKFAGILETLWDFPKPVVVKLNGHVRAGGLGLVAGADIVVAPSDATFAFAEVRIGVAPAMIAVLCMRRMTPRAVGRYLLTGERFDADAAVEAGLVTQAVGRDQLDAAVETVLADLRCTEPKAVAETKALLRQLPGMSVAEGLAHAEAVSARLFSSPEAAEGMAAFAQKRPPSWQR